MADSPENSMHAPAKGSVLREGLTTGSTATGAAMAAMLALQNMDVPDNVSVPLPPFCDSSDALSYDRPTSWRSMTVAEWGHGSAPDIPRIPWPAAYAGIVKDGGDDPDATTGALFYATICHPAPNPEICPLPWNDRFINIRGCHGVGVVTKPGLALPVGEAAINPVPRMQIRFALGHLFMRLARSKNITIPPPFTVIISVPAGEKIAERTLNSRLGIIGGISVLGTQGTVRPFSHAAWIASLRSEISVARCSGANTVCMGTGRRSEQLLRKLYPHLPAHCFLQVADCAEDAIKMCVAAGFENLVWGCFFGKLLKLAQGMGNTHADRGKPDMNLLASLCAENGATCASSISSCLTAQAALDMILAEKTGKDIIMSLLSLARERILAFAGRSPVIHLFHLNGMELARI